MSKAPRLTARGKTGFERATGRVGIKKSTAQELPRSVRAVRIDVETHDQFVREGDRPEARSDAKPALRLGDVIPDERYPPGGSLPAGARIDAYPITPNLGWVPPKYRPFELDELVAVHVTDQPPTEGRLDPHVFCPVEIKRGVDRNEKYFFPRVTTHWTLNGMVADHSGGGFSSDAYSWAGRRFGYIVPLREMIDEAATLFTHDTIVLGSVRLPASAKIIENPTPARIEAAVRELGLEPLRIAGVQPLDPAWTSDGTNVNHPDNFKAVRDAHRVRAPYTAPSNDNVLALDSLLTNVLEFATGGNLLYPPQKMIAQLDKRLSVIKASMPDGRGREALELLEAGVGVYRRFLRAHRKLEREMDAIREGPGDYSEKVDRMAELAQRGMGLRSMLSWENNQDLVKREATQGLELGSATGTGNRNGTGG
ncbi:MAG: hypothetical protein IT384_22530 [Deltaproteobacteria bacterium]|nr:hypothetical protein [Deltaproteobacteria bacterium]